MTAGFDDGQTLAERFRTHAGDSTTLYGYAMRAMADDWEAGGVVREICRAWEDAPRGSFVQLRLLAGVFRLVLRREAPALAPFYACIGGGAAPAGVWPVMREVMAGHVDELRGALAVAPQTNEVGRSSALVAGIFEAVRRTGQSRLRLLEPGASAGLNLLVDRFRFEASGWGYGPLDSPLVLRDAIHGHGVPAAFTVVSRRGCDLEPVDLTTPQGRLRLTSFVWPFDVERHERLRAALAIAREVPVTVDRAGASEWLEWQLALPPEPVGGRAFGAGKVGDGVVGAGALGDGAVLTVVWQSVTRLYWPAEEAARVAAAIEDARGRMPLAHIAMEYPLAGETDRAELTLDGELLARVAHHGSRVDLI